jgi:hypothetical protein
VCVCVCVSNVRTHARSSVPSALGVKAVAKRRRLPSARTTLQKSALGRHSAAPGPAGGVAWVRDQGERRWLGVKSLGLAIRAMDVMVMRMRPLHPIQRGREHAGPCTQQRVPHLFPV